MLTAIIIPTLGKLSTDTTARYNSNMSLQPVMPYTRDTSRLHVEPSLYHFDGDDKVSAKAYEAAMRNTYFRKVPLATAMMKHFGIPYSKEDQERVKRLMVATGWLDHLLDEAPDRAEALDAYRTCIHMLKTSKGSGRLPSWVRPELRDATTLLGNAIAVLPEKDVARVVEKALRIGNISVEKTKIHSRTAYAAILTEEGALSSDLAVECLSPACKSSPRYQRLHSWDEKALIAATLLDSAKDLKQDYADKLTSVRPSIANKAYLFGRAVLYAPVVFIGLGLSGIRVLTKVGSN